MMKKDHLAETSFLRGKNRGGTGLGSVRASATGRSRWGPALARRPGELTVLTRGARREARGTSEHTAFTGDAHSERAGGRSGLSQPLQDPILACSARLEGQPLSGPRGLDLAPFGHRPPPAWLTVQREGGLLWSFLMARV